MTSESPGTDDDDSLGFVAAFVLFMLLAMGLFYGAMKVWEWASSRFL